MSVAAYMAMTMARISLERVEAEGEALERDYNERLAEQYERQCKAARVYREAKEHWEKS